MQQQQLKTFQHEKDRTQNLVTAGAATRKQLDDVTAPVAVLERQIALIRQQRGAQASALNTQRSGTLAEAAPLAEQVKQLDDQIANAVFCPAHDGYRADWAGFVAVSKNGVITS